MATSGNWRTGWDQDPREVLRCFPSFILLLYVGSVPQKKNKNKKQLYAQIKFVTLWLDEAHVDHLEFLSVLPSYKYCIFQCNLK